METTSATQRSLLDSRASRKQDSMASTSTNSVTPLGSAPKLVATTIQTKRELVNSKTTTNSSHHGEELPTTTVGIQLSSLTATTQFSAAPWSSMHLTELELDAVLLRKVALHALMESALVLPLKRKNKNGTSADPHTEMTGEGSLSLPQTNNISNES